MIVVIFLVYCVLFYDIRNIFVPFVFLLCDIKDIACPFCVVLWYDGYCLSYYIRIISGIFVVYFMLLYYTRDIACHIISGIFVVYFMLLYYSRDIALPFYVVILYYGYCLSISLLFYIRDILSCSNIRDIACLPCVLLWLYKLVFAHFVLSYHIREFDDPFVLLFYDISNIIVL